MKGFLRHMKHLVWPWFGLVLVHQVSEHLEELMLAETKELQRERETQRIIMPASNMDEM